MTAEVRRCRAEDLGQIAAIRRETFRTGIDEALWLAGGWVLADGPMVEAMVLVERAGQIFREAAVSCALVRSVAVAPHARNGGRGSRLLAEVLGELRRDGIALSVLFPTGLSLYRRLGYEVAGSRTRYRQSLDMLPREGSLQVEPLGAADLPEVRECYKRFAGTSAGLLERPEGWWKGIEADLASGALLGRAARSNSRMTGYMLHTQRPEPFPEDGSSRNPLSALGMTYSLHCRDLCWTDLDSAQSLLSFAAASRGLGLDLCWFGPFPEPLTILQERQNAIRIEWTEVWMARLLEVKAAIEARGYPMMLSGRVSFEVMDRVFPENGGGIAVEFSGGCAQVQPGAATAARIDVGTLAAVYTGRLTVRQAAAMGLLVNASERDFDLLDAAFAGPSPWIMDIF